MAFYFGRWLLLLTCYSFRKVSEDEKEENSKTPEKKEEKSKDEDKGIFLSRSFFNQPLFFIKKCGIFTEVKKWTMFLSSPLFLILSYIILKKTVRSFNASRLKLRISLPSHKPNKRITNVSFLQFIFYVSSFWENSLKI